MIIVNNGPLWSSTIIIDYQYQVLSKTKTSQNGQSCLSYFSIDYRLELVSIYPDFTQKRNIISPLKSLHSGAPI